MTRWSKVDLASLERIFAGGAERRYRRLRQQIPNHDVRECYRKARALGWYVAGKSVLDAPRGRIPQDKKVAGMGIGVRDLRDPIDAGNPARRSRSGRVSLRRPLPKLTTPSTQPVCKRIPEFLASAFKGWGVT